MPTPTADEKLQHLTDAVSLLRRAHDFVKDGAVLNGRDNVRHMLLDALHQAQTASPYASSYPDGAAPPVLGYQARHFQSPAATQALRCVCLCLPRPTTHRSNNDRIGKIHNWGFNQYVTQERIVHVLTQATLLATNDVFTHRERTRLLAAPGSQPRLCRWRPETASRPHLCEPPARRRHEKVKAPAFVVAAPYNLPARQQDLQTAAQAHGLRLYEPLEALGGVASYDALDRIVGYRTRLQTDDGAVYVPKFHADELPPQASEPGVTVVAAIDVVLTLASGHESGYPVPYAAVWSPHDRRPLAVFVSSTRSWNTPALLDYLVDSVFHFHPEETRKHHEKLKNHFLSDMQALFRDWPNA